MVGLLRRMPCAKCHFEINKTMVADQEIIYVYLIAAFSEKGCGAAGRGRNNSQLIFTEVNDEYTRT